MLPKGRLSTRRAPLIRAGNVSLRYATEVKYLGISTTERMSFLVYIERVWEKMTKVVGLIRRNFRNDWGLSSRALLTIYGGLFVAHAAYGASVWY